MHNYAQPINIEHSAGQQVGHPVREDEVKMTSSIQLHITS